MRTSNEGSFRFCVFVTISLLCSCRLRRHRLSLVDATSFTLMARHRLRAAFTFDTHFAEAGFRCVG